MTDLLQINDETVTTQGFITYLKLNGRFDELVEELVSEKITGHAARRMGLAVTAQEIQDRADQIRRVAGLHRAIDMNRWLEGMRLTLEDLDAFIVDMLYNEKMQAEVVNEVTVDAYFKLNSPKFDAILLSHIVVDSEGTARELIALLEEEPGMFEELAREHSKADTRSEGGYIGKVSRGSLVTDIEAKVFNADVGQALGPFATVGEELFEIFLVNEKRDATLDGGTEKEIRTLLKNEWLEARAKEFNIEVC
jgi:parvulin-like peptidyl-prolyl isomerase